MKKDMVSDMKVYQNAKKVSKILSLSNSNLRKYSQILEDRGYQFTKEEGKINYLDKDIIVLRKMIELLNLNGFTLDEAVKDVISMFDNGQKLDKTDKTNKSNTPKDSVTLDLNNKGNINEKKPSKEKSTKNVSQNNEKPVNNEIDNIEKKLDKAIEFIMERAKIEAEFEKVVQEKDEIIAKLKAENEQHKRDKQIINLRDKLLLETIRRKQQEQRNMSANNSFWSRKKP